MTIDLEKLKRDDTTTFENIMLTYVGCVCGGLPLLIESLDEITNPDKADETGTANPEISDTNTMCKKGDFEGFKILIGMFWSHVLSKSESKWVDKKYLINAY